MLLLATFSLIPRFLLGFLTLELIWRKKAKRRVLELVMAGPMGVGISSLLSFLWIWMGLELRLYALGETVLMCIVFALWARHAIRASSRGWQKLRCTWPPGGIVWWGGLSAAALFFSAQFWTLSLQKPHGSWDAWVHWNVVSRFVYRGGELWQGTFLRILDQPDYPLLIAMTNATTWELVQKETSRGPMTLAFLSSIALVGLLFSFVRELRGAPQASLAAIAMLTHPLFVPVGFSQYADVPEACYFLASTGLTLLYLRSRDRSLATLAGLMAGLGAWAKNEGLVFAAATFLLWAYLSWRGRSPALKDYLLGAALPLSVLGLFKAFLAPGSDLFSNPNAALAALIDPSRYLSVLQQAAMAFWNRTSGSPALLLLLAAYACLVGRSRQKIAGQGLPIFFLAVQSSAYLLVYVATPFAYGTAAMIPTSIGRLYFHVLPLLLLALFLWLKSPEDLGQQPTRATQIIKS